MASNRFDPDAATRDLYDMNHINSADIRASIISRVQASALVDIAESLRKLTGGSDSKQ